MISIYFWFGHRALATSFRLVTDSIYTERFMGMPTLEDNLDGYDRTDISRQAEGIRGKKYMLIHGTGDDNVHYQQAMSLAKTLERNDIMFQQITYTDESHTLIHVFPHLYHTMDKFWGECFRWDHWPRVVREENRLRNYKSFALYAWSLRHEKRNQRE